MKTLVTIEEHVSQTFEVDAETLEEALEISEHKYNTGEFVITQGEVTARLIQATNRTEASEWQIF